jgi:hypothetical protein
LILPESGVAGQCDMPPVPTIAIRSGTASAARRSARPKAWQRAAAPAAALAVDVGGHDGEVVARREEMQRHHDAVVELPLLRVREIDLLHDLLDEAPRERGCARHLRAADAQPRLVLDGPSYSSAIPMQKAGMLFMKKLAKCSAAMTTRASGRAASSARRMRSSAA